MSSLGTKKFSEIYVVYSGDIADGMLNFQIFGTEEDADYARYFRGQDAKMIVLPVHVVTEYNGKDVDWTKELEENN